MHSVSPAGAGGSAHYELTSQGPGCVPSTTCGIVLRPRASAASRVRTRGAWLAGYARSPERRRQSAMLPVGSARRNGPASACGVWGVEEIKGAVEVTCAQHHHIKVLLEGRVLLLLGRGRGRGRCLLSRSWGGRLRGGRCLLSRRRDRCFFFRHCCEGGGALRWSVLWTGAAGLLAESRGGLPRTVVVDVTHFFRSTSSYDRLY
jgi:hypothetical protein